MYHGGSTESSLKEAVEGSDMVLALGGTLFEDFSAGLNTAKISRDVLVSVRPDHVEVVSDAGAVNPNEESYSPVFLGDVIDALLKQNLPKFTVPNVVKPPLPLDGGDLSSGITYGSVKGKLATFFQSNDIFINETGSASFIYVDLQLPEGCAYQNQTMWGSIGWATPAAFGAALAAPDKRVILVTGDGSHQLTANEIGAMGRYGAKPIIFCLNNGVFGIEEFLEDNEYKEYNDLAHWEYSNIPGAMGCSDWKCCKVSTNAELDQAMQDARTYDGASYIEVVLAEKLVYPPMSTAAKHQEYKAD